MKYVIIIPDGSSDHYLDELDGKTPLEVANTPNMDKIANEGFGGLTNNVPDSLNPGSDVANMSIFGYNPEEYYTGRGPLEAGSIGIKTSSHDIIISKPEHPQPNGTDQHQDDIDVLQFAEKKGRYQNGENDDDPPHRRRAPLAVLSLQIKIANGLPDLHLLQPADDLFTGENSDQQRENRSHRRAEHHKLKHPRSGNIQLIQIVKKIV